MLNYRDQIIEVKHLSTVFGEKSVDEAFESYESQMVPVLIIRNTHRSYGLIVNTIIGQRNCLKVIRRFLCREFELFLWRDDSRRWTSGPHFKPRRFIIGMKESSPLVYNWGAFG